MSRTVRPSTSFWPVLGFYAGAAAFVALPVADWLWLPGLMDAPEHVVWAICGLMAGWMGRITHRRWQYCRQRPGLTRSAMQLAGVIQGLNPGKSHHDWRRLHNADDQVVFVCCRVDRAGKRWELARVHDDDVDTVLDAMRDGRTTTAYWETFVVRHGQPVMLFQNVDSARPDPNGRPMPAGPRLPLTRRVKAGLLRLHSGALYATEEDLTVVLRQLTSAHTFGDHHDDDGAAA